MKLKSALGGVFATVIGVGITCATTPLFAEKLKSPPKAVKQESAPTMPLQKQEHGVPIIRKSQFEQPRLTPPTLHSHKHPLPKQNTLHDSTQSKLKAAAPDYAECNFDQFGFESGSTLVNHIKSVDPVCTYGFFGQTTTSKNALSPANMTTVLNAARSAAVNYKGTNEEGMEQLFLYIRAGYYHVSTNYLPEYSAAHQSLVKALISDFSRNSHMYDSSDQHGESLYEFMILIQNVKETALGLPIAKRLIDNYNQTRSESYEQTAAVNGGLGVLYFGSFNDEYKAAVTADNSIIDSLFSFIRDKKWILDTNRAWLYNNSGSEFGRFLGIAGTKSRAKFLIKQLLPQLDLYSPVWLNIAAQIDYHTSSECGEYSNVCGYKEAAINQILPITNSCGSTLKMRVQEMTAAQMSGICSTLATQETYFHNRLNTGNNPVAGDLNEDLLMIIFNSDQDYKNYGGPLYGIPTNNGGYYLEGDPSDPDNQATFYAEEADWLLPEFKVWNLEHEYVHYLDGRFNMFGSFSAPTVKVVWWSEGLAEYISLKDDNQAAIDTIKDGSTYTLGQVLDTTYDGFVVDRIYRWGYLAVRFMFEKHPAEVTKYLNAARAGNWNTIQTLYDQWKSNYSSEFTQWTEALAAGGGGDNKPPVAVTDGPYTGNVGQGIAMSSNSSSDPDGTITSRNWNFGDGTSSTSSNPNHTYSAAGTYTVTLTVTDNDGATGTTTTTATITNGGTPDYCAATGGGSYEWIANVMVGNLNNSSGAAEYSDFTGQTANLIVGNNSATLTPGFQSSAYTEYWSVWIDFNQDGDFSGAGEQLINGQSSNAAINATLNIPASASGVTTRMRIAMKYNAAANSSCGDIGDGEVEDYTVSIAGGSNQAPISQANGPYSGAVNSAISFNSNGSSDSDGQITSYHWDFGDGSSSSSANPNHIYTSAGSYTATLTVTDDDGETGTDTGAVTVTDSGGGSNVPDACANENPVTGGRLVAGDAACLASQSVIWLSIPGVRDHNSIAITTGNGTGNLDIEYSNQGWPNGSNNDGSSSNAGNGECIYLTGGSQYWGYIKVSNSTGGASIVVDFDSAACR
ncbi:collagenase [Aliikangiella coralliicola]|uniref:microbial collagenase n=1 Tax=Aliikangiella coralliicola TaxID=2592383 RepID=A0A545U4J9_9GAMM|nr:collagenase [Aliikangiella coralliicola]TQV84386.1 PKD domain-containing protein [Aliikangiella coralliicola]